MTLSIACRLCLQICLEHRSLYDEKGLSNEVYDLTHKYFASLFLNMASVDPGTSICLECWRQLFEFHTFQQSVLLAHRNLAVANPAKEGPDFNVSPVAKEQFPNVVDAERMDDEESDKIELGDPVPELGVNNTPLPIASAMATDVPRAVEDLTSPTFPQDYDSQSSQADIKLEEVPLCLPIITKVTGAHEVREKTQDPGNVSTADDDSGASGDEPDEDEEWEEFDDPVGVFAGGEFDKNANKTVESESGSQSEVSIENWSSEDEMALAEYADKKNQPQQERGPRKTKTRVTAERPNNVTEVEGPEGGPTSSDDRGPEAEGDEVQKEVPEQSTETTREHPANPLSKSTERPYKTAADFDVSASDGSESDGSVVSSSLLQPLCKAKPKYKRRKRTSYKTNLKRPKTIEEFDDYIAQWRPTLACVLCTETCATFTLLRQHFEQQHPHEQCHIICCQHKFYHRYEVEKHIHFHNEPEAHKCQVCYKCFTSAHSLRQHLEETHSGSPRDRFKCPKCSRCYAQKGVLVKHLRHYCDAGRNLQTRKQKGSQEVPTCSECGKIYKTRQSLRSHKRSMHRKSPPLYECTICDKAYKTAVDLREHMAMHAGEAIYTCEFCTRTFVYRSGQHEHYRKKHRPQWEQRKKEKIERRKNPEKKSYKCTECENVYQTPLALREHQASHAGKAMYACKLCSNSYKYSSNLAAHVKRVHNKEQQKKTKTKLSTQLAANAKTPTV